MMGPNVETLFPMMTGGPGSGYKMPEVKIPENDSGTDLSRDKRALSIELPTLSSVEKGPSDDNKLNVDKTIISTSSLSEIDMLSFIDIDETSEKQPIDVDTESVLSILPSELSQHDDESTITYNATAITIPEPVSATPSPHHSDQFDTTSVKSMTHSKATTPAEYEPYLSHVNSSSIMKVKIEYTRQLPNPSISRPSVEKVHTQSKLPSRPRAPQFPHVKPRSAVPSGVLHQEYANQCVKAAEMCRLSPYYLHPGEVLLFRKYISKAQVTTYLNIRNGILRLWVRNPQVAVAREEAMACAGRKWLEVASVCYDWLVRNGYINFGCVHQPKPSIRCLDEKLRRRTIVVIGAGVAGLGCSRQLDGLFRQYSEDLLEQGEAPPRLLTIEARNRVGGRVYSKPFNTRPDLTTGFPSNQCIAEMGGMIITGFHGNPLNFVVRGQLGLAYHALRPETTLYDSNGLPADLTSDQVVEQLFNDSLDRVSEYKFDLRFPPLVVGNIQAINEGRDSHNDGTWTLKQIDDAAGNDTPPLGRVLVSDEIRPIGNESRFGCAATKAKEMGWNLRKGVKSSDSINLDMAAIADKATMGSVFEEVINQWSTIVDLKPLHLRLLNWHVANLEYSNATDLHNLSLGGWDIDAGNEWEGKHTMVKGGYQAMAKGLLSCPEPLDCRFEMPIKKIVYNPDPEGSPGCRSQVICEDGSVIEADHIICTIPLGVLKSGDVKFDPPLPESKQRTIDRLGYGILNKVVLTYQDPFWDTDRDIFGILRNPDDIDSREQSQYADCRGRLFQWFNVSESAGLPCLVALMAGKAGYATEKEDDEALVLEATTLLRKVYGEDVPFPTEVIVTRWGSDKYSYGSYSSAGTNMAWNDYDQLSKPVGNLIFAGEHTTGTHPATVHGAYMSGLRAASDLLDAIIGPLRVPEPLFPNKEAVPPPLKRKTASSEPSDTQLRQQYEQRFQAFVTEKLGLSKPQQAPPPATAYVLFRNENSGLIKERCLQKRRYASGKIPSKGVSQMTSKLWRALEPQERNAYERRVQEMAAKYKAYLSTLSPDELNREARIKELRQEFEQEFPFKKKKHSEKPTTDASVVEVTAPVTAVSNIPQKTEDKKTSIATGVTNTGIKLKLKIKLNSPDSSLATPPSESILLPGDKPQSSALVQMQAQTEEELFQISEFPARRTQQPVSYVEPSSDVDLLDGDVYMDG